MKEEMINNNFIYKRGIYCCSKPKVLYEQGKAKVKRRQIRNDKKYHPSKETVILLGLSLELNEQEIDILLNSASYSLPKNNRYDLIIRFCFINKIYKISTINELLFDYNCKLFDY